MAKADWSTGYTGGLKRGKKLAAPSVKTTGAKVTTPHSAKKGTQKGHLK